MLAATILASAHLAEAQPQQLSSVTALDRVVSF